MPEPPRRPRPPSQPAAAPAPPSPERPKSAPPQRPSAAAAMPTAHQPAHPLPPPHDPPMLRPPMYRSVQNSAPHPPRRNLRRSHTRCHRPRHPLTRERLDIPRRIPDHQYPLRSQSAWPAASAPASPSTSLPPARELPACPPHRRMPLAAGPGPPRAFQTPDPRPRPHSTAHPPSRTAPTYPPSPAVMKTAPSRVCVPRPVHDNGRAHPRAGTVSTCELRIRRSEVPADPSAASTIRDRANSPWCDAGQMNLVRRLVFHDRGRPRPKLHPSPNRGLDQRRHPGPRVRRRRRRACGLSHAQARGN